MTLSKRIARLECLNVQQEPDTLFMATIYEQKDGTDEFGGALAFANWPDGRHEAFSAMAGETYEEFRKRVEAKVKQ